MALVLEDLLTETKFALRDTDADDSDCYAILNSVKDEFQAKAIEQLGANALNAVMSSLTITLTSAYSYTMASASPAIGRVIEAKLGDGTNYLPMRQTEGLYAPGLFYDPRNPEYRINGNYLDIKFEPSAGDSIIVYYAPQIYTVSSAYTGLTTYQSYQIDEVDRAWCWYAAARKFESDWEDLNAQRCRQIAMNKILSIKTGSI